ncbi:MAG: hypothetical protein ACT4PV_12585 [Planctomycetaceae bacterium]
MTLRIVASESMNESVRRACALAVSQLSTTDDLVRKHWDEILSVGDIAERLVEHVRDGGVVSRSIVESALLDVLRNSLLDAEVLGRGTVSVSLPCTMIASQSEAEADLRGAEVALDALVTAEAASLSRAEQAIRALSQLGSELALPGMLRAIEHPALQAPVADAIALLPSTTPAIVSRLHAMFETASSYDAACTIVQAVGVIDSEIERALNYAVNAPGHPCRTSAAQTLGILAPYPDSGVPALLRAFQLEADSRSDTLAAIRRVPGALDLAVSDTISMIEQLATSAAADLQESLRPYGLTPQAWQELALEFADANDRYEATAIVVAIREERGPDWGFRTGTVPDGRSWSAHGVGSRGLSCEDPCPGRSDGFR